MLGILKELFHKLVTLPTLRSAAGSQVRHLVGALGGYLVGLGLEEGLVQAFSTNLEETLIGASALAIAYAYSRLKEKDVSSE